MVHFSNFSPIGKYSNSNFTLGWQCMYKTSLKDVHKVLKNKITSISIWNSLKYCSYFFTVLEFSHNSVIIPLGNSFRITHSAFYESFQAPFEKLIDLVIVVIVVSYSEHALYVIPNGATKSRCVDLVMSTHSVIRKIVRRFEFIVEKITNVIVQPINERIAMIIPWIVLDTESRYVV